MKKIFKMANAELGKIFMRPSMFILFTVLVVALVLSYTFFKPEPSSEKYTSDYVTISQIYPEFEGNYRSWEEDELVGAKKAIDDYLDSDVYTDFTDAFSWLNVYFDQLGSTVRRDMPNKLYVSSFTDAEKETLKNAFKNVKDQTSTVREIMKQIKEKTTNVFISNSFYDYLYKRLGTLYDSILTSDQIEKSSRNDIIELFNNLDDSFDLEEMNHKVQNLERVEIDNNELTLLLDEYYYSNIEEQGNNFTHQGKLQELYDRATNYYLSESTSGDNDEAVKTFNEYIAQFKDYINICKTLLENKFELLIIGNKTDDEIASLVGFSGSLKYTLQSEVAVYEYYNDNNTFGYEYLRAFNFNVGSGTEANAYDFCFFAMQILSTLIILFIIFFACGMISGEQNSGTLKMVATRPYTRNKIYSGKFIACIFVAVILLAVSFIASLAVGVAVYGFTSQNVLVVVGASKVLVMHPLLLMLIYFASLILDVIFYIALAILISMLIKPTTISTGITAGILIASTIITGSTNSSWIRFVPSLNTGVYKFFTSSNLGIFSFSIAPNVTMFSSLFILIGSVVLLDLLGRLLFTHRSIDK